MLEQQNISAAAHQTTQIFSGKDLVRWANRSRSGARIVYHVGLLCYDRDVRDQKTFERTPRADAVGEIADEALDLALRNEVFLLQRKLADGYYEYIAVRTDPYRALRFDRWRRAKLGLR